MSETFRHLAPRNNSYASIVKTPPTVAQPRSPWARPFCSLCNKRTDHKFRQCPIPYCMTCNQQGHPTGDRKCKMVALECWPCHQMGHVKAECPFYVCKLCGQQGHLQMQCRKCMMCLREDCKPGECPQAFCLSCSQWGHVKVDCPKEIQRQNNGIAMQAGARNSTSDEQKCHHCNKTGHSQADCLSLCLREMWRARKLRDEMRVASRKTVRN